MSHAVVPIPDLDRPARDLVLLFAAHLSAPFCRGSAGSTRQVYPAPEVTDAEDDTRVQDGVAADVDTNNQQDNLLDETNRNDCDNGSTPDDDQIVVGDAQLHAIANGDDDDNDSTRDLDERAVHLLGKCREGTQRPSSSWEPIISALISSLPTHGPALDPSPDAPDDAPVVYSTGTTAAALSRFLPALDAHGLDIYDVVLCPENMDTITSPWDPVEPIVEASCGLGDWLLRVRCGRVWYDDVREEQELAGGTIFVEHIVHRQTHVIESPRGLQLGEGYDRDTEKWFAFMRSGHATLGAFIDAHYGPLLRAARVLQTSFGWSLKRDDDYGGGADDDDDDKTKCSDIWGIRSASYPQSHAFVRRSDGAIVHVDWQWGSLFVSAKSEPMALAPEAYSKPPRDRRPPKVPRPPADYAPPCDDAALRMERKAALAREHADRTYLVGCGLLDSMHVAPVLCRSEDRGRHRVKSCWPCVRVAFDPMTTGEMDATAEADWHRRLASQMHTVADLIKGVGPALSVDNQDVRKALATEASPQLAAVGMSTLHADGRFDAETLTTWASGMLSPMVRDGWRVASPRKHMRCGSRYIDPARGLFVNWNMRCNFVPTPDADGLAHARFYGHLLVVGDHCCNDTDAGGHCLDARATLTDRPTSDDPRPGCVCAPTVAAYYALSIRDPRAWDTYDQECFAPRRSKYFVDMDDGERAAVDAVINDVGPARESRFASDQPHHVIDHYRRIEFAPVPAVRFRGILDEDALRLDSDMPTAVAMVRAFDWLREAFDRHAAIFAAEC
ncbi:hypothetical protein psal_cds_1113 [Pandoravirus salinus]|uniref:Uncharacterized protein n=1 Tax=Pandoravirus salinus TaxID=1349410 RepID=S4W3T8_9VIRU|nr:hypothetical protein psal_cds_1113 [Pandoravirus salinus]AGO85347.1 hypothetical protein psal_cds_1113 [Pandoravirus salinus]